MGTRREMDGKSHEWTARAMGCSPLEQPAVEKKRSFVDGGGTVSQKDTSHKLNKNTVFM